MLDFPQSWILFRLNVLVTSVRESQLDSHDSREGCRLRWRSRVRRQFQFRRGRLLTFCFSICESRWNNDGTVLNIRTRHTIKFTPWNSRELCSSRTVRVTAWNKRIQRENNRKVKKALISHHLHFVFIIRCLIRRIWEKKGNFPWSFRKKQAIKNVMSAKIASPNSYLWLLAKKGLMWPKIVTCFASISSETTQYFFWEIAWNFMKFSVNLQYAWFAQILQTDMHW